MDTQSAEHTVDTDILRESLIRTRRRIKLCEAMSALMVLVAYSLLLVTAAVIADHIPADGLSEPVRHALRGIYLVGACGIVAALALVPMARKINDLFAAWVIEHRFPEFRNSLISALQLIGRGDLPGSIRAALAARAAEDVGAVDLRRAIDLRHLRRAALWAGAGLTLFVLYAALAPKPVIPSVRRLLGADLPAPTRTQILVEEPAPDFETLVGTPVKMVAQVTGRRPDQAHVRFSVDGGTTWLTDQQLLLDPPPTHRTIDPREEYRWRAVKPGRDVQQSVFYQFVAGDGQSQLRALRVRPYPTVASVSVRLEYPPYTRQSPRETDGGNVDAVVGTLVIVRITTSVRADHPPQIAFRKDKQHKLRTSADDRSGTHFTGRFRVDIDEEYAIDYRDQNGIANNDTVVYTVRARPDEPPRIEWARPEDDLTLSRDDSLDLAGRATDDFGLSEVLLAYEVGSRDGRLPLVAPSERPDREASIEKAIPLTRLRVEPGDRVAWWIIAKDNRCDATNHPTPQTTETTKRHFTVREATPPVVAERPKPQDDNAPTSTTETTSQTPAVAQGPAGTQPSSAPAATRPSRSTTMTPTTSTSRPTSAPDDLRKFVERHRDELERLSKNLPRRRTDEHAAEAQRAPSGKPKAAQTGTQPAAESDEAARTSPSTRESRETVTAETASKTRTTRQPQKQQTRSDDNPAGRKPTEPSAAEAKPTPSDNPAAPSTPTADQRKAESPSQQGAPKDKDAPQSAEQPSSKNDQQDQNGDRPTNGPSDKPSPQPSADPSSKQDSKQTDPASERPNGNPPDSQPAGPSERQPQDQPGQNQTPQDQSNRPDNKSPGETSSPKQAPDASPSDKASADQTGDQKTDKTNNDTPGQKETPDASPSEKTSDNTGGDQKADQSGDQRDSQDGQQPGSPTNQDNAAPSEKSQDAQSASKGTDGKDGASQAPGDQKASGQNASPQQGSGQGKTENPSATGSQNTPEGQTSPQQGAPSNTPSDHSGPLASDPSPAPSGQSKDSQSNGQSKLASPQRTSGGGAADEAGQATSQPMPSTRPDLQPTAIEQDPQNTAPLDASLNRAESGVNALDRLLRENQGDPNLLKDLGWTPEQAQAFIKEFRSLQDKQRAAAPRRSDTESTLRLPTRNPGDDRLRSGRGRDAAIRPGTQTDRREADDIKRLLEVRRQQVGDDYRDILEAYYRTMAAQPPPSTRPAPRR